MSKNINIPEDARARYLERRKVDLEMLRADVRNLSFDAFKRIGHQLRGNAASFGYPELEAVGIRMEDAGDRQDQKSASTCLEHFAAWVTAHTAASPT